MSKKKETGKPDNFERMLAGLDDLTNLSAPSPTPLSGDVRIEGGDMLRVDRIEPDPDQPRRKIDPAKIAELAKTISEQGQLQPINVRPNPNKPGYYLINWGERRWRAFILNHEEEIRAEIKEHADVFLAQLTENIEREDLAHMEIAYGIQKLQRDRGYTQQQVMQKLGKSQAWVSNYAQLPLMPDYLRDALEAETITDVFTAVEAFRLHKAYPDKVTELVVGAAMDAPVDRSGLRALAAKLKSEDNRPKGGKAKDAPAASDASAQSGRQDGSKKTKPAAVAISVHVTWGDGTQEGVLILDPEKPTDQAHVNFDQVGTEVEIAWSELRIRRVEYH